MIPGIFAADGCGEGTVLVDGVCQLAPEESNDGCGEGTVLVDGVCQLAPEESNDGCGEGTVLIDGVCQLDESSGTSIPSLYIAGGAAAVGAAVIGIVFAYSRNSKTPKPAKQDLEEYEKQYLVGQNIESTTKPAEKKETSAFCDNCGQSLKPKAKFCGGCGTPRS
jgi:hypothetical protein